MSNASSPGRAYPAITESTVEVAALHWLEVLGWNVAHGPDIAPDTPGAERADYGQVFLQRRLRDALALLNPDLPTSALFRPFQTTLPKLHFDHSLPKIRPPQMGGTLGELPLTLVQQLPRPLLRSDLGNALGQSVAALGIGWELIGIDGVVKAAVGG